MLLSKVLKARGTLVRASSSVLALSAAPSRSVTLRRHLVAASSVRWNTSTTPSSASAAPSASSTALSEAAEDAAEDVKIDLSAVGAEDAKVLTIADVLNAREQELMTNKGLMDFEEWESISGTETVHEAVAVMAARNIGSLIVTEEKEGIVGIVTERDVVKKISPRTVMSDEILVHDVMSSHIMCIHPNTTVIDALATMTKENIRHLAVVNGDMTSAVKRGSVQEEDMRCVLSITDIVRAFAEFEAAKNSVASEAVAEETLKAEAKKSEENKDVKTDAETAKTEKMEATAAPVVTAASLLKQKHKRIKLILNTRPEDNITVAQAVEEMANRDFGAVLVVDKEQRVLGIFTERDYIRKVLFEHKDPEKLLVTDVMSSVGSVLQIEDPLEKCWDLAATSNCRHFPVIGVMRKDREKELAGILSIKDIVREISKDHHATPGFRLMEFLKSKMEPKPVEPKPEPKVESSTQTKAEAATESKPEAVAAPTEGKDSKTAAPVEAAASKEPKAEAPATEATTIVEEPATHTKL
ncbi:Dual specificity protein phosphatase 23 [Phytophthora boehmeriae]|uniref:Dual specificity protein phosphatase 23 n=1 Tax=Phytophthora boehmeriae TaxID=109152 RepID=A0A8T1WSG1_9STRA|nr:Dual specificity protein phosphatase 23 [Phytophthora boehmeriae]